MAQAVIISIWNLVKISVCPVNTKYLIVNAAIMLTIAACATARPTPIPATGTTAATATAVPPTIVVPTTPVAHNADWQPVSQSFAGVEMMLVPPGCFIMGHNAGRRDERPEHQICFLNAFWIDRTEATNGQYGSEGHFPGANRPRENLLWSEARDFCTARGARLPSEAEWEFAARGPDNLIYPWGGELDPNKLVFDRNSGNQTAEVGSMPTGASWVGALDMSGNVFEWVSSLYQPYPYDATDGREDLTDNTNERVYRGGIMSYLDYAAGAAIRFRMHPDERDWFLGFRCARDA